MSDEEQPEYCDCKDFHDGSCSCKDRRLDMLEKLAIDLEQALTQKEKRIADLEKISESVYQLLNDAYNKAHLDAITKVGIIGRAVSHSIQDLDCVLHGEGKFSAELRQQFQKSIYTIDEVQKLLERCFSLGIEAGRNEYFISDYCGTAEQEEEAINALHKQLLQFYKETNFKVGF